MQVVCSNLEPEADGQGLHLDRLAELLLQTIKGTTPLFDALVCVWVWVCACVCVRGGGGAGKIHVGTCTSS